jgi:hypothetical protein
VLGEVRHARECSTRRRPVIGRETQARFERRACLRPLLAAICREAGGEVIAQLGRRRVELSGSPQHLEHSLGLTVPTTTIESTSRSSMAPSTCAAVASLIRM